MSNTTSDEYRENYAKIFGDRTRTQTGSWVVHPDTGEVVPRSEYNPPRRGSASASILRSPDAFVSTIDGTVISDRAQLRRHNEMHGVANLSDYGENNGAGYFERKASERESVLAGNTPRAKRERIETIKTAIQKHGG